MHCRSWYSWEFWDDDRTASQRQHFFAFIIKWVFSNIGPIQQLPAFGLVPPFLGRHDGLTWPGPDDVDPGPCNGHPRARFIDASKAACYEELRSHACNFSRTIRRKTWSWHQFNAHAAYCTNHVFLLHPTTLHGHATTTGRHGGMPARSETTGVLWRVHVRWTATVSCSLFDMIRRGRVRSLSFLIAPRLPGSQYTPLLEC